MPQGMQPEVGVDYAFVGLEGSQVTIFGVQMQTYWMPGSDTSAREGHECLFPGLLGWMAARLGMETIVTNGRVLAFLRAAAASFEGVEVIEQAGPEGDLAANGLAEVGVREVKAQTRVLKRHWKRDS